MENGLFLDCLSSMNNQTQKIIDEFKSDYLDINFDVTYQDSIPAKMVGFYRNIPIFSFNFFEKSISFDDFYNNFVYKKYIQPNIKYSEKFLIESSGVNFDYNLHRPLITKLIPKIVYGFKKYYIDDKEERINEDFKCRT